MINNFINNINKKGKKKLSQKIFRNVIVNIRNNNRDPKILNIFLKKSLENVQPKINVKSKKIAGSPVKIPVPYINTQKFNLSIKWLSNNCRNRPEKRYADKLYNEISESFFRKSFSYKKKISTHKVALNNRPNLKFL